MKNRYIVLIILSIIVMGLLIFRPFPADFPETLNLGLRQPADDVQTWLITNRSDHPIFIYFFEPLSEFIDSTLEGIEEALLALPAVTIIAAVILFAYRIAGLGIAILSGFCVLLMGVFDLWDESMQTLALILLSVIFSLFIGIPLGIAMAFNRRIEAVARPVLDAMQTLPTFVYLIPAILFFGVAGVPSLVATVIYAVPPAARLTYLGIRQVPVEAIEAAQAFGSTRRQMLWKVQLPMALPSIMAGVNQTIMMALSMVVIASLIGAGGLGREVLFALRRLQVGQAVESGLAIVAMAVMLDRLSFALSKQRRSRVRNRYFWITALISLTLLTLILNRMGMTGFPETWHVSIREPVDSVVEWAQENLYQIGETPFGTGPFSDFLTLSLLLPLRDLLQQHLSWVVIFLITTVVAYVVSGWRLALLTIMALWAIGLLGMWEYAMDTLSQVIVAVIIAIAIGIPIGILAARSLAVERVLRPVLDTLQTIPTFVYLVPMIMLFDLGRVPGIIASILYALPPVIRLTSLGIQQVDKTVIEAAQAFGSSSWQTLFKVQLPLALPSIMAGINQTMMMVLAMVVVAGLVGGSGLGFEVVSALAANEMGRGLEAGLAIVALAIVLDRITQAMSLPRHV